MRLKSWCEENLADVLAEIHLVLDSECADVEISTDYQCWLVNVYGNYIYKLSDMNPKELVFLVAPIQRPVSCFFITLMGFRQAPQELISPEAAAVLPPLTGSHFQSNQTLPPVNAD